MYAHLKRIGILCLQTEHTYTIVNVITYLKEECFMKTQIANIIDVNFIPQPSGKDA